MWHGSTHSCLCSDVRRPLCCWHLKAIPNGNSLSQTWLLFLSLFGRWELPMVLPEKPFESWIMSQHCPFTSFRISVMWFNVDVFQTCFSRPWRWRPVSFLSNNSCNISTDYFPLLSALPPDDEKLPCSCHWAMHFNEALFKTAALPSVQPGWPGPRPIAQWKV